MEDSGCGEDEEQRPSCSPKKSFVIEDNFEKLDEPTFLEEEKKETLIMVPKKEKIRRKSNLPDTKRSSFREGFASSRNEAIKQEQQFCATSNAPVSTSSPESNRKKANSVGRTSNAPRNKAGNAGMTTNRPWGKTRRGNEMDRSVLQSNFATEPKAHSPESKERRLTQATAGSSDHFMSLFKSQTVSSNMKKKD